MALELADGYDIAWACGIFEADGSVHPNKTSRWVQMRLTLKMTDQDIVDRFDEIMGVGNTSQNGKTKSGKLIYEWSVGQTEAIKTILTAFWPYLGKRRRARAIELGFKPPA